MIKLKHQDTDHLTETPNHGKIWESCKKCIFLEIEECGEIATILESDGFDSCDSGYYAYV